MVRAPNIKMNRDKIYILHHDLIWGEKELTCSRVRLRIGVYYSYIAVCVWWGGGCVRSCVRAFVRACVCVYECAEFG